MGKLIYSMLTSLDGYTEDDRGEFGLGAPNEEVHACVNELASSVGTYLYGRRMYETMQALRAGVVDEVQMFVFPVVVGGGKRFFPAGVRLVLDLIEERGFGSGVLAARYSVRGGGPDS